MAGTGCLCRYYKPQCAYCRAIEVAGQRLQELEQEERPALQASTQHVLVYAQYPWGPIKLEAGV